MEINCHDDDDYYYYDDIKMVIVGDRTQGLEQHVLCLPTLTDDLCIENMCLYGENSCSIECLVLAVVNE